MQISDKTKLAAALAAVLMAGPALAQKSAGEHMDDATVGMNVKGRLIEESDVSAGQINIEVYKGVVTVAGFVGSGDERRKAIDAARKAGGVEKVIDATVIMPGKRSFGRALDDQNIHNSIDVKLFADKGLTKGRKISVQVRNGEVLLSGFAPDQKTIDEAVELARSAKNVSKVHNKIMLQS